MNREIKFRAWDKDTEYMFYSDKSEDEYFFEFKNGKLRGYAIRPPRSSSDPMEPPEPYCDDYPVMQSTGLKNKNGKDLDWWEGDVFTHAFTDYTMNIVFEDGSFWFKLSTGRIRYQCYHSIESWQNLPEKIGTIHDNPNLEKE